jgi:hypothetical protein
LTLVTPNPLRGEVMFSPLLCGEVIKVLEGELPSHVSSSSDFYTHVNVVDYPCRIMASDSITL